VHKTSDNKPRNLPRYLARLSPNWVPLTMPSHRVPKILWRKAEWDMACWSRVGVPQTVQTLRIFWKANSRNSSKQARSRNCLITPRIRGRWAGWLALIHPRLSTRPTSSSWKAFIKKIRNYSAKQWNRTSPNWPRVRPIPSTPSSRKFPCQPRTQLATKR
jgi:hypothetical protein